MQDSRKGHDVFVQIKNEIPKMELAGVDFRELVVVLKCLVSS